MSNSSDADKKARVHRVLNAAGYSDGGKSAPDGTKWIQEMHMKKGALHAQLHVPSDEPIPAKKLEKASHSSNPLLKKRANVAKTLEKMH